MSNGVRYTPTFAMPTEYERAAMEARRRQRMAEMLAQQEFKPSDYPTAPIPSAYPLARVLKGFLSGREEALAEKAEKEAKGIESEYAKRLAGRMGGVSELPDYGTPEQQMARIDAEEAAQRASGQLQEVTPTAQYRFNPQETLEMASTEVGTAALKNRPLMAARLAKMLEKPAAEEFGTTPVKGKSGKYYLPSKSGRLVETDVEVPEEGLTPYQQAQLDIERERLDFQKSRANQAAERPKPPSGFVYVDDTSTDMTYAKGGPYDPDRVRDLPPNIVLTIATEGKNAGKFANTLKKTNEFIQFIESGQLPLNKLSGAEYATRRAFDLARGQEGEATEPYVRYYELERFVNQQVNSILNLAKGPQTEGDALRARQQILDNPNNEKIVLSALKDLQRIWNEEIELSSSFIEDLKTPYGRSSNRSNW